MQKTQPTRFSARKLLSSFQLHYLNVLNFAGIPRHHFGQRRDNSKRGVLEKDRRNACPKHCRKTCPRQSSQVPAPRDLLLWFPCRRSSHGQHLQIFWPHHGFHWGRTDAERFGRGQLCDGLVKERNSGVRLPHDEERHVLGRGITDDTAVPTHTTQSRIPSAVGRPWEFAQQETLLVAFVVIVYRDTHPPTPHNYIPRPEHITNSFVKYNYFSVTFMFPLLHNAHGGESNFSRLSYLSSPLLLKATTYYRTVSLKTD